jgi:Uma2 family endonuclease
MVSVTRSTTIDSVPAGEYVPTADHRIVMHGMRWSDFESFIAMRGVDAPGPRVTYLEGTLELMSPSRDHESIQKRLALIAEAYFAKLGVKWEGVGSWLLRHAPKEVGIEPDECYILHDLRKTRPDLAIEVVWTSGGISKLEIYRRIGVPEVWIWQNDQLAFWILDANGYRERPHSGCIPVLDTQFVSELLRLEFASDVQAELKKRLG